MYAINYDGEATVAMDAVLKRLAEDNADGDWYVEIVTHDAEDITGYVRGFVGGRNPVVTLDLTAADDSTTRTGQQRQVGTADIEVLTIP